MTRAKFRVIPPRQSAPAKARRRRQSVSTSERTVEHCVYGVGVVRYIKPVDDGTFAALVNFAGSERLVHITPRYWLTPVDAILRLAPHLPPPVMSKPKPKTTEMFGDVESDGDETEIREEAESLFQ